MTWTEQARHPASFRDPHGFVYEADGVLLRAVEAAGAADYEVLVESGLYDELSSAGLLVRHDQLEAVDLPLRAVHVLRPARVPVISYASEWTFSQLRAAALLTLDVQERALHRGMVLRDANTFNVQFIGVRPIFIDTLSFGRSADGGAPWVAYRQFCEQFLGPLALIAHHGHSVSALWSARVQGLALTTASALLPAASWLQPGIALHLHMHARAARRQSASLADENTWGGRGAAGFGLRLVASLRAAVQSLSLRRADRTSWTDYRKQNTYSAEDTAAKIEFVRSCAAAAAPARAIDLGANDGLFAQWLAQDGVPVTAVDSDAIACEAVFNGPARAYPHHINTAHVDLSEPTPSFGWAGLERSDFQSRYRCDLVLALALVHHLSIGKQIPFAALADWFAGLGMHLIVEYVPVHDPMAARLLAARPAGFPPETFGEQAFLDAFTVRFEVIKTSKPSSAGRILFWMRRRAC